MPFDASSADELSLSRAANTRPDGLALLCPGGSWTFGALWERVRPLCAQLAQLDGILALSTCAELSTLCWWYAALETRTPLFLLHPGWDERTRQELLTRVGPAALLANGEILVPQGHSSRSSALAVGEQFLVATSGSTSGPKIVVLSRDNLLASARASEQNLGWHTEDRWLFNLPFGHVGGLSVLTRCLAGRKTVVAFSLRTDQPGFCQRLQELGVTLLSAVPAQLLALRDCSPPSGLRAVLVGGAAAPHDLIQALRVRGWPLLLSYGMSEMASQIASEAPPGRGLPGLRPLSNVELRIGPDQQILVRGPSLMRRYWDDRAPLDHEGFLCTRDRGAWLPDGGLQVLGRLDSVLISGGENISPEWVEQQLGHPDGVEQLCVLGLPDERWGQRVVLAYVPSPPAGAGSPETGRSEREARLLQRARERLPKYCVPKQIVAQSQFPTLAVGKVDRRALAEQVARALD